MKNSLKLHMQEFSAYEDIKIANKYLSEHRCEFDKQIDARHKQSPKSDKQEMEQLPNDGEKLRQVEKEIRDFNLQLTGHKSDKGEWHPLNPDVQHDDTLPSPIPPLEDSLRIELESPRIIEDPETGQKFTVLMLNWNQTKNPHQEVLLTLPGFNNTAERKWWNQHTTYKGELIARMTGKPVLIIDHPQHGSGVLTPEQRKALISKEDYAHISDAQTPEEKLAYVSEQGYGKIAEAEIRAVELLNLSNDFILFGGSMGAWSVAKMAEVAALREEVVKEKQQDEYDLTNNTQSSGEHPKPMHVKKLVLFDYPGIKEFTEWEIMKVIMKEGQLFKLYKATHADPIFRGYTLQRAPAWKQVAGKLHEAITTFSGDPNNGYKIAMGRPTLPQTLSTALAANPNLEIQSITGTESLLCPRDANDAMIADLKQHYPGRIHKTLVAGETHGLMENPKRYAKMVILAIRTKNESTTVR